MMISHGALLEDVYGTSDISKKKKDRKNRSLNNVRFLPELEKDIEKEKKKHIYHKQQSNENNILDEQFNSNSNITPFSDANTFFDLQGSGPQEKKDYGSYFPRIWKKSY